MFGYFRTFISLECNILQRHEVSSPDQPTTMVACQRSPAEEEQREDRPHRLISVQAWPGRVAGQSARPEVGNCKSSGSDTLFCPQGWERESGRLVTTGNAATMTHGLNCTLVLTQRPLRLQMLNYGEQGLALGSMTSKAHRSQQRPPAHSPLGRETRQQCRLLNIIQDLLVCPSHCAPGVPRQVGLEDSSLQIILPIQR